MNRKITFRGKDVDDGKWYEGYYLKLSETTYCCEEDYKQSPKNTKHYIVFDRMTDWGLPNKHLKVEVDPTTVGQYTGLQDKNGIQIFEGDVVRCISRLCQMNFVVVFEDGEFRLIPEKKYLDCLGWYAIHSFCKEVIGNIHDNPELISKEETEND